MSQETIQNNISRHIEKDKRKKILLISDDI